MPDPLLIAAPESWRDACYSLPAVRALAAVNSVTVLCHEAQESFWKAVVGDVLICDKSVRKTRDLLTDYSRVLLWEPGLAAKASRKAGIGQITGMPVNGLEDFLTDPLDRDKSPGPVEHGVKRFLDTAIAMGAGPMEPSHFEPIPTDVDREPESMLIVPGSDYGDHYHWPLENWIKLIEKLQPDPEKTFVGGIRKDYYATELSLPPADTDAPEHTAAYQWCITSENSLAHIAASYGTTCAVLYGPGDPAMVRPLGKQHVNLRHKVECSPCFADKCRLDLRCQNELEVDHVYDLIKQELLT